MAERIVQRKKLGSIGVDSGQVMVCDPCYLNDWKDTEFAGGVTQEYRTKAFDYDGACRETCYAPESGGALGGFLAVVASSGYGDGEYPVYADYNAEGRIVRLVIDFSDCEEETRAAFEEEDDDQ